MSILWISMEGINDLKRQISYFNFWYSEGNF
nr:MAG TPA: hypothetical protein [Caudoviricetes sp.]